MKNNNNNDVLFDMINGYDITIKDGDICIIKNGITTPLANNQEILNNCINERGI